MFQFPGFPSAYADTRCSQRVGFPIRTSLSQRLSPARQGFSQVIASFVGSSARASTVDPSYLDHSFDSVQTPLAPCPFIPRFASPVVMHPARTSSSRTRAWLPSERLRKDTGQIGGCQGGGGWLTLIGRWSAMGPPPKPNAFFNRSCQTTCFGQSSRAICLGTR